jgi:cellulose synthase/poly-beta-1,6-N-acetylglucosamine synthase-like glycosyltransferase
MHGRRGFELWRRDRQPDRRDDVGGMMETLINIGIALTLTGFGVYGLHRLHLVALALRHRDRRPVARPLEDFELPSVTVQLPVYNEVFVVERLIRSAAALDYPRDRFEIQVLDDSTDETREIADRCVAEIAVTGLNIRAIRRETREGFKAGALAHGLASATGAFIAIFDADFVPPTDFLLRVMPHFANHQVGMVQCRWGFLNEDESLLTQVQALSLKAHFGIEHLARARSGRFFNFNGTAGVWRKRAIEKVGGWQGDTLTEDLDLSYRAQLAGWRFEYLDDVECPSELPPTVKAYKAQQFRWMKGMAQVARKLLPEILRAPLPLRVKIEAFFHLMAPLTYTVALASFLLLLPLLLTTAASGHDPLRVFYSSTLGITMIIVGAYHLVAEAGARRRSGFVRRFLALVALGIGNSLNSTRAVAEGLLGHASPFMRTPKYGAKLAAFVGAPGTSRRFVYQLRMEGLLVAEALLAVYAAATLVASLYYARSTTPWALLFLAGCLFILTAQIRETLRREG